MSVTIALEKETEQVSLLGLKRLALQMLPTDSHLRDIILSEPDFLGREEVLVLMQVFVKMLYLEMGRT